MTPKARPDFLEGLARTFFTFSRPGGCHPELDSGSPRAIFLNSMFSKKSLVVTLNAVIGDPE